MGSDTNLYDAFATYGSGVGLVTVRDGGDDAFFVAASVLTASVDPFALAVSVGATRPGLAAISKGGPWTLSVLAADHLELVRRLTAKTTHAERLAALRAAGAERSPDGTLRLADALATFSCVTASTTPVNDQVLVVGSVVRGVLGAGHAPLLRWDHEFHTVAGGAERKLSA
ncbi:NADH-FMN oxidoreductase RutF, flavin reductase (DIM6/NTAB) family [Gordonia malaquae]|uniref:Putative NADPH-flavin oxidoreductase n=1 Tax=Gordonia malaquae NBRC 108250 TaxID=1223542 RepID=M3VDG8_GORML|nr:flavin reductase family protein [Gordonia malaquae]GAC78444.1 putative NADPH-flavin oxidoreductase [Gordonia malaquae NBRC 108250]SED38346.1 NADH-FMN oxidoreductase RutF, flavin reductase (DIM6/NTAB) family [Gordonia malaquae]